MTGKAHRLVCKCLKAIFDFVSDLNYFGTVKAFCKPNVSPPVLLFRPVW